MISATLEQSQLPPPILRPYQTQMISAWEAAVDRGVQRGLIVAATGTGKTTVFSQIIGRALDRDDGNTALVIAHAIELLDQSAQRIASMNPHISVGVESGEHKCVRGTRVAVGSVQSLGINGSTRLDWLGPRIVVCDEAHHAAADTYQRSFQRFGCYEDDGTLLLGVTATPHRLDNKALIGGRAIFEEIVFRYDIVAAIRDGFLVDVRGYRCAADFSLDGVQTKAGDYVQSQLEKRVNTSPVNEHAFNSWQQVCSDQQTIVFCVGVDHCKDVAAVFREHGVRAEPVYGDMPKSDREKAISRFRSGEIQVLTNMNVLTEGFDAQHCGCVLLLRPTKSWSLFTQMVGRGLRTLPGVIEGIGEPGRRREAVRGSAKPECTVIDIVGVGDNHQLGRRPDGGGKPSLQALLGLPDSLDLEGMTIVEAVEEFEKLPDVVKAAAFKRPTSFSGLSTVLTQVEMLSELEVPDEVSAAGAALYWLKTGEAHYEIDCGNGDDGMKRFATINGDLLGNWQLKTSVFQGNVALKEEVHSLPDDLGLAFIVAEGVVRKSFLTIDRLAARNAPWRTAAPTDKQLGRLRSLGVKEEILSELDKGRASAMISILAKRGGFENA